MLVDRMSRKTVQFNLRLALAGLGIVLFGISISSLPTYMEFSLFYVMASWSLTALVVVHNSVQLLLARCRIRESGSGTSTVSLVVHGLVLFASIFLTTLVALAPPPPWQPPQYLFRGLCIRAADASIACSGAIVILQTILVLVEAAEEQKEEQEFQNQQEAESTREKDPESLRPTLPLVYEDLDKKVDFNVTKL